LGRGFVFEFDENQKDIDILFVGINLSYGGDKSEGKFYSIKDVETLNYFRPFNNIIKELDDKRIDFKNLTWSHLDMLVFRETQQSFIKNQLLKTEEGIQFIDKQLIISKQILEYLNPKIIVCGLKILKLKSMTTMHRGLKMCLISQRNVVLKILYT